MHRGISSDLFQIDGDYHFYQSRPCRVQEWNLTTTRIILQKHIFIANQLAEAIQKLKNIFVTGTDNSIRLMMQKYLIDEQQIFFEYFEYIFDESASTSYNFQSIVE